MPAAIFPLSLSHLGESTAASARPNMFQHRCLTALEDMVQYFRRLAGLGPFLGQVFFSQIIRCLNLEFMFIHQSSNWRVYGPCTLTMAKSHGSTLIVFFLEMKAGFSGSVPIPSLNTLRWKL